MTRYGMAIDLKRCFGCQACAVACKIANNIPKGVFYNVVFTKTDEGDIDVSGLAAAQGSLSFDVAGGSYPDCSMYFLPRSCQHCEKPACMLVCPTGATQQRDDGIVSIDGELCIGCASCIEACPYEGVRTLLNGAPEYYLDMVVGEADAPKHSGGTVEKCTFCANLIDRGRVPACMQLCPGRARYWGDLDDPESGISKVIAGRTCEFLHESAGTQPQVYYLR